MLQKPAAAFRQQVPDIGVTNVFEVTVPFAHREKERRRRQTDKLVGLPPESTTGLLRSYLNRDDHSCRFQAASVPNRSQHGVAGGNTIVNENRRMTTKVS
jgi:hypothetical protein